jgi:hypothetical protein
MKYCYARTSADAQTAALQLATNDEMESGKVQGIDGEEAYRRSMEKTQARRQQRSA